MSAPFIVLAAAAAALLSLAAGALRADEPARYPGRIVASETGVVSTRLDGVVAAILFEGGEAVTAGQPLIRLDPFDAETALAAATARRDAAAARLAGAEREAGRVATLSDRGVATDARRGRAETDRAAAAAALAEAEATLRQAQRNAARTVIRAPIAGRISRPEVAVGAFVEAEAGPPLARIVTLDPALAAYDVPYAARLASLRDAEAASVDELLGRISLQIELPDGALYSQTARPGFADAHIDPDSGAVTVWAEIANPDAILRPGLTVTVLSRIGDGAP